MTNQLQKWYNFLYMTRMSCWCEAIHYQHLQFPSYAGFLRWSICNSVIEWVKQNTCAAVPFPYNICIIMYTYIDVCTQCTGQLRYVALHVGHAAPAHYAYIVCYKIVSIPAHFFKMAVTVQKTV